MIYRLLSLGLLILPTSVLAQPPQPGVDPCSGIGGCERNGQALIGLAVQNVAAVFVAVAAGAAVLFVVVGGFQMLISFGNESTATKGRNSVIFALSGFALTLAAQAIISFVVNCAFAGNIHLTSTNPALTLMATAVNIMMSVFNVVFALVAIGAGFRMVLGHGKSDEFTKARSTLLFAIIGAVVINVARALVNIVLTTGF